MENRFSWLYWQRRAVDDLKEILFNRWDKDKRNYVNFFQANKSLGNIEIDEFPIADMAFKELFHHVLTLWKYDPIIFRIIIHNITDSEDMENRTILREKYLPNEYLDYYFKQLQLESVLEDSELAKFQKVKGLPVHLFLVGEMLGLFLGDYARYSMIDKIKKETGASTSIEELRDKSIRFDNGSLILDYFPFYKDTIKSENITREFFNKENFLKYQKKSLRDLNNQIDDLLYFLIQKVKLDQQKKRRNNFFGNPDKITELKYILKYENKNITIPLQLLPKYTGLIRKRAKEDRQNNANKESFQFHENKIIKIFLEAVLGESYKDNDTDLQKPLDEPFSAFIVEHIKRRKSKEWDNESIVVNGKRISKEPIDHSVSMYSEDEEVNNYINNLPDEGGLNPESAIISCEEMAMFQYAKQDERFMSILTNEKRRSDADQKYFERKIKDIKILFKIQK